MSGLTPSLQALILMFAQEYKLSPYMLAAVIKTESSFRVHAVGAVGERGLMQLRPEFHLKGAESPDTLFDPVVNIRRGARYLHKLQYTDTCPHKSNYTFVICYNLGPSKAKQIKSPTSQTYYKKFKENYERLKATKVFDRARNTI